MLQKLKFLLILCALILLASCRSTNIEILAQKEQLLKGNGDFQSYLALEYLEYSRSLYNKEDWWSAEHFAIKGLKAAKTTEVKPEMPEDWGVGVETTQEVIAARERLNVLLNSNLRNLLPIQLAHLLMLFDCFVSTDTKPVFEYGTLATCQAKFYKLLAEMEQYSIDLKAPKQTTPISELEFERFKVYFNTGSYQLNHNASVTIVEIIEYLKVLRGNYQILLIGSTDRTGKELANQDLSARRVEIVKNYLISNGATKDLIETRSLGENYPDIITVDSASDQSNRKVAIYILKNSKLPLSSVPLPLIETYIYKKEIEKKKESK